MCVASKIHNILLVQLQPEERLAASPERNLASSLVTGCGEVWGMGYGAATQVKGFRSCSETICWSCGSNILHCNSQFDNVVISDSRGGDSTAQRRVTYGNKTGLITYLENDRAVPLNSGMRESFKFGSVRGLIAASGGGWL